MTRPTNSPLVLDGGQVKLRLTAERIAHKSPVHVDWVRFTCLLRNAPAPSVENLFPVTVSIWDEDYRKSEFQKVLRDIPDADFVASAQALDLANEVCKALGPDFSVVPDVKKGHDFYKFRWSIVRNDSECGWVGFLSSGDSPRQASQAQTIHANIYGAGCTFAENGWNDRIADIVDSHDAKLTRADLALDFFDGIPGGLDACLADFEAGLCDSGGKRLTCNMVGDWSKNPRSGRSLYFGSKEAGKQTNVYEKGHQLFGFEAGSNWLRAELRYGNKLRVLPSAMLRRPAEFFAGASDWHQAMLFLADSLVVPEKVPTHKKLAQQTVAAEVSRNVRWAFNTAAPTIAAAFQFLGSEFLELVTNQKLPGRLQKFSKTELQSAFSSVFSTVGGAGPAFA
jgi:phage replication initiation protein